VEKRRDLEKMGKLGVVNLRKEKKKMAAGSASGNRIPFFCTD
jgi:hypothetical protein